MNEPTGPRRQCRCQPVCRLHHLFDAGPLGSLDLWFVSLQRRLGVGAADVTLRRGRRPPQPCNGNPACRSDLPAAPFIPSPWGYLTMGLWPVRHIIESRAFLFLPIREWRVSTSQCLDTALNPAATGSKSQPQDAEYACSEVACAKLYDRKPPITAGQPLNPTKDPSPSSQKQ
jgi:hypothetical protein